METVDIYLEIGKTKAIAASVEWPGWCRSGRDEEAALQALINYGPRYARVIKDTRLQIQVPVKPSSLVVVERLVGNASTDFGVPDIPLPGDSLPVTSGELDRWQAVLNSVWKAFDQAAQAAAGKELSKGPRGGGRDLAKIVEHVLGANTGYISSLGGKFKLDPTVPPDQAAAIVRKEVLSALAASIRGEYAPRGPRGGLRWSPRYFVRRLAWHDLDHAWEIEDRIIA